MVGGYLLTKALRAVMLALFAALAFAVFTPSAHAGGVTYGYDSHGQITSVTNSNGTTVTYSYDAAGNRTQQQVTVNPAAPVANAVSATVAYNSTNNTIPLNITGGAATSVAVSTQATHGAATANGTAITYTPPSGYSGSDSFQYTATNATGTSAPATVTVTVAAVLAIATATLPTPVVNQAYSQTVATSGGTAPITFSVSVGALPSGLALTASSGVIAGTPTTAGGYSFTIKATDSKSTTATQAYSGTIAAGVVITTATLPTPVLSTAYSQTVATSGGTTPITFSVSVGSLPAGLALNTSTGVISGTPTTAGAYSFTIKATDANAKTATQAYSGTIVAAVAITTATLPTPVLSTAYSQTVATSGGTTPITFSVSVGSLPAGLSLTASSGLISGTPTAAGAYSFTIKATDANAKTATQAYSGTIASNNHSPVCSNLTIGPITAPSYATVTVTLTASMLIGQCTDADGDTLTVTTPTVPYDVHPASGQTVTVPFTVSDGKGGTGGANAIITRN